MIMDISKIEHYHRIMKSSKFILLYSLVVLTFAEGWDFASEFSKLVNYRDNG